MTGEEAVKIIGNYEINGCGYCHQGGDEIKEAFDMAIKSLEAWDKVIEEISQNGNSDINTQTVLQIIKKHLGEVKK